jgi:hypothetical protein
MTSEGEDISCVDRNLTSLGLGYLLENTDSFSGLLDQAIKVTNLFNRWLSKIVLERHTQE